MSFTNGFTDRYDNDNDEQCELSFQWFGWGENEERKQVCCENVDTIHVV